MFYLMKKPEHRLSLKQISHTLTDSNFAGTTWSWMTEARQLHLQLAIGHQWHHLTWGEYWLDLMCVLVRVVRLAVNRLSKGSICFRKQGWMDGLYSTGSTIQLLIYVCTGKIAWGPRGGTRSWMRWRDARALLIWMGLMSIKQFATAEYRNSIMKDMSLAWPWGDTFL